MLFDWKVLLKLLFNGKGMNLWRGESTDTGNVSWWGKGKSKFSAVGGTPHIPLVAKTLLLERRGNFFNLLQKKQGSLRKRVSGSNHGENYVPLFLTVSHCFSKTFKDKSLG